MRNIPHNRVVVKHRERGRIGMKQCLNCSARNPGDAKFCKDCGSSLENVPNITSVSNVSQNLSATASGILNKAGNLLIEGSKKIGNPAPSESGGRTAAPPLDTPSDGAGPNADSPEFHPRPQSAWKDTVFDLLRQKRLWAAALAVVAIIVAVTAFGGGKSRKFVGLWKMYPDQMPGYGISLDFDKDTIDARGDYVNYGGRMNFKYKVVSDSELILQYDWAFNQWPWAVAYADEIPLNYSLSKDGTTLTLTWSGTSFVFLDNTNNMDYFHKNGATMTGGSVTFTKVK